MVSGGGAMTIEEYSKLMIAINTVFQVKAEGKAGKAMWYKSLEDLDYDLAAQAVKNLTRTHSGWLYPAQIRQACMDITNPKPSFTEAYQLMNDSIRKFGRYRHQEALDYIMEQNPHMHTVVKAIGFQTLCNSGAQFTRGPVERMYKEVIEKGADKLMLGNYQDDLDKIRAMALPRFRDGEYD